MFCSSSLSRNQLAVSKESGNFSGLVLQPLYPFASLENVLCFFQKDVSFSLERSGLHLRFLFASRFLSGPAFWGHHLFQMTSTLALVPFLAHILLFSSAVLLYVVHVLWLTLYQALERNGAQTALCLFWFPLNCVSFRIGTPFFKISLKWIFSLFLCGCESADHKVLRF